MKMIPTLTEIPLDAATLARARHLVVTRFGGFEAAFCCMCWLATSDDEPFLSREARLAEGVTRFLCNQPKE